MAEISQTGDQMLQLLELIAFEGRGTAAELAQKAGMNRTVVHRLIATLHARGYVVKEDKSYAIGPVLAQLAAESDDSHLLQVAAPVLAALAAQLGETVVIHKMDGQDAVVIDQSVSEMQLVRVQHRVGSRHPLALGASGKAILAFQPEAVIERILSRSAEPAFLRRQLEITRETGFAQSSNELQNGVVGYAVPLREGAMVRFSLAAIIPTQRAESADQVPQLLLMAQARIEALMQG